MALARIHHPAQSPSRLAGRAGGFRWWFLAATALCAFECVPLISLWLHGLMADLQMRQVVDFGKHQWLFALLVGGLGSLPIAYYCLVGLIMALHWRPGWQRLVIGLAIIAFGYGVFIVAGSWVADAEIARQYLAELAAPVSVAVSITLAFVAVIAVRMRRRWVISLRDRPLPPRPITLGLCLFVMSWCGVVAALLRFPGLPESEPFGLSAVDALMKFLLHVGLPAATACGLSILLLPGILGKRRSWWGRSLRLMAALGVVAAGPSLFWALAHVLPLTDANLSVDALLWTLDYFAGSSAAAGTIAAIALFWMRVLGFQLTTAS